MKRRFAALFAAALISMVGVAGCADRLREDAEQRAREEIDRQIDKGRKEVEKQVDKARTEAEQQLQEGRRQAEKELREGRKQAEGQ
jgi:F0F1-type ATP synthase membrane subunit b/b'